jgi:hypothetical protein
VCGGVTGTRQTGSPDSFVSRVTVRRGDAVIGLAVAPSMDLFRVVPVPNVSVLAIFQVDKPLIPTVAEGFTRNTKHSYIRTI